MLSVAAESEDILFKESDRTNGRLPVRGVRLLIMYIFGLSDTLGRIRSESVSTDRFCGELVEPFVAVFG